MPPPGHVPLDDGKQPSVKTQYLVDPPAEELLGSTAAELLEGVSSTIVQEQSNVAQSVKRANFFISSGNIVNIGTFFAL